MHRVRRFEALNNRFEVLTPRRRSVLIAAAVAASDQLSKAWARTELANRDLEIIPGWFDLSVTENTGAAFSMFRGYGSWLGIAAILVGVLVWMAVGRARNNTELVALSLILGGAIGNIVDRALHGPGLSGGVTDFIALSFWPTFNLADSAITIGAVLMIWKLSRPQ